MAARRGYRESIEAAKAKVLELLDQRTVLHKAEAMVALEDYFFQWVTGRAIDELRKKGTLGAQARRVPTVRQKGIFIYEKGKVSLTEIRTAIKRKVYLMGRYTASSSPAGIYAEDLFQRDPST